MKIPVSGLEEKLARGWSAVLRGVERFTCDAFPKISAVALEMDAAGLASSEIPKVFARDVREIEPSLNDDLLDLYGQSEQALANHFTFLNRSRKFESEIDWECDEDPAWRAELHAFDYAFELALTYRISCEERYARHLRYLMADWIAANPPPRGTGWLLHPLARRVRNWIIAADLAREDWERDADFLQVITRSLALQTAYLYPRASSVRPGLEPLDFARALNLAGRFFSGGRGAEFRSRASTILFRELKERILSDGGYIEPIPNFQLQLAATLMEFLLLEGSGENADFLGERLRRVLGFLEGIVLPDGPLPLFGCPARSAADVLADLFALSAVWFNERAWKGLAGRFGILPYMLLGEEGKARFERLPQCAWKAGDSLFPESGLYRLSGSDSSAVVINGHPPSSPERHQDFLSFELSIQGQRVIVDSGALAPEGESSSHVFRAARAHNVLLVDGQGSRALTSQIQLSGPETWEVGPDLTGLRLLDPGFRFLGLNYGRAWYCLDGRCWVVLDRLEGQGSHRAVDLLHFYPVFQIELASDRAIARSRASAFTVIPLGRPGAKMRVCRGDQGEYPGWYAPEIGLRYPANVLVLEWPELELPWVGGYLIFPGAEANFCASKAESNAGRIGFEISGKQYQLGMG